MSQVGDNSHVGKDYDDNDNCNHDVGGGSDDEDNDVNDFYMFNYV